MKEKKIAEISKYYFEKSNELLCGIDQEGCFLNTNPAWGELLGYSNKELKGKPVIENIHTEDIEETINSIKKLNEKKQVVHFQNRYKHKDGSYRWLEWRSYPFEGKVFASAHDITEQKEKEKNLILSQARYLKVFMSSPFGVSIISVSSSKYIDVNEVFIKRTGYGREEVVGKTPQEINLWVNENERNEVLEILRTKKTIKDHGVIFRMRSGEIRDYEISAEIIDIENERCFLIFSKDITEHRRIEENLQLSNERYHKSFNSTPYGVSIVSIATGKYIDVNEVFIKRTGFSREEVVGKSPDEFSFWVDENELNEFNEIFRTKRYVKNFNVKFRMRSGEIRNFEMSAEISEIQNEPCFLIFTKDITDQIRAEEELRSLLEIHQTVLDALIAGVIHIKDNLIIWANDAFLKMNGYEKNELIGQPIFALYKDPQALMDNHDMVIHQLSTLNECIYEFEGKRKDGSVFWVRISGKALDKKNPMEGSIWMIMDIDKQKRAELELLRNQAMINNSIKIAGLGSWEMNLSDNSLIWAKETYRIFGIEPLKKIKFEDSLNSIHQDDKEKALEHYKEITKSEKPIDFEFRIVKTNGDIRTIQSVGQALKNEKGKFYCVSGIVQDVTEKKEMEIERQQNLHLFESLDKVNRTIQSAGNIDQMLNSVLKLTLTIFNCDRAFLIYPNDPESPTWEVLYEASVPEYPGVLDIGIRNPLKTNASMKKVFAALMLNQEPLVHYLGEEVDPNDEVWERFQIKSAQVIALKPKENKAWQFGIHQCSHIRRWTNHEKKLFREISRRLADGLSNMLINNQLVESEEKYRTLVDNMQDAIYRCDLEGKVLFTTESTARLLGYPSVESIIGMNVSDFYYFSDKNEELIEALNKYGFIRQFEVALKSKNSNKPVYVMASSQVFKDRDGKIIGIEGVFHDITERKLAEEALIETKERLQMFLDSATDSISIYDSNLNLVEINKKAFEYLPPSIKKEDVIGVQNPFETRFKDQNLSEAFTEVLKTGNPVISEDQIKIDAKNVYWFISKIFKAGDGIGVMVSDITALKQAEEEVRKLNTELEKRVSERTIQLEKANKDLEAFAYSISHDLRAPLRHIDGFVNIIFSSIQSPDEKTRDYFEKVTSSIKRMSDMIDELLNFSRLGRQNLKYINVDLNILVKEIIEQMKPDYENRNIAWKIEKLPIIKADATLLRIVFDNLISNAVKYTSKNPESIIEIGTKPANENNATIYIKDNGSGFDMVYTDKLFGVFQRLHSNEDFEGIGIGLANVKQIVTKHKGNIYAESKVNEGATFYVTLPRLT